MNLIQMNKKVQEKENKRQKLIGQKEMKLNELKKLGFKGVEAADKAGRDLRKSLLKMNTHYENGVDKFKELFGHLLT